MCILFELWTLLKVAIRCNNFSLAHIYCEIKSHVTYMCDISTHITVSTCSIYLSLYMHV